LFPRGRCKGVFRIGISVAALGGASRVLFCDLLDAERHGRVAHTSIVPMLEALFLKSAPA